MNQLTDFDTTLLVTLLIIPAYLTDVYVTHHSLALLGPGAICRTYGAMCSGTDTYPQDTQPKLGNPGTAGHAPLFSLVKDLCLSQLCVTNRSELHPRALDCITEGLAKLTAHPECLRPRTNPELGNRHENSYASAHALQKGVPLIFGRIRASFCQLASTLPPAPNAESPLVLGGEQDLFILLRRIVPGEVLLHPVALHPPERVPVVPVRVERVAHRICT